MNILLVNNNTVHMEYLLEALANHDVEIVEYKPGAKFNHQDKDMVILSGGGGEGLEIHDRYRRRQLWYDNQMKFVKNVDKPVLGICMGFEVISRAFGAPVKQMKGGLVHGYFKLSTTPKGRQTLGKDQIMQFKAHSWYVPEAPRGFDILATSPDGIEIIKHQTRPILAVQFHPEKGGSLSVENLLASVA